MDTVDQIVSAQISARREAIALSQQQLSERAGISCQQIQDYETGKSRVPASQLAKLAEALGVEAAFFFFLPEETNLDGATASPDATVVSDQAQRMERAITALATIKSEPLRQSLMTIIEEIARIDADRTRPGSL